MAWLSEKAFERLGSWVKRSTDARPSVFSPLINRLTPIEQSDTRDWVGDADWARLQ